MPPEMLEAQPRAFVLEKLEAHPEGLRGAEIVSAYRRHTGQDDTRPVRAALFDLEAGGGIVWRGATRPGEFGRWRLARQLAW